MPKPNQREGHEGETSRSPRAVIYLSEVCRPSSDNSLSELSIHDQGVLCRRAATMLNSDVVEEFVEEETSGLERPELHQVLALMDDRQVRYLIVSSLDRLAVDVNEAFDISWRLYLAGSVAVPADWEYEFPWCRARKRSRD